MGKGAHMDFFLLDVGGKDFSNLDSWGHTLLFIGGDLVTRDCIDDLVELKTLETSRIGSGVWLRLKPISDERWEKAYEFDVGTAAGTKAYHEKLTKDKVLLNKIHELTKGRFR